MKFFPVAPKSPLTTFDQYITATLAQNGVSAALYTVPAGYQLRLAGWIKGAAAEANLVIRTPSGMSLFGPGVSVHLGPGGFEPTGAPIMMTSAKCALMSPPLIIPAGCTFHVVSTWVGSVLVGGRIMGQLEKVA